MPRRRALLAAPLLVALPRLAQAAYPERTVTLATGFAPGGSTDVAARLLADRLGPQLGPQARVVVENRPGAGGTVASDWLRRQPPDGHILMLAEASSHAVAPNALPGGTRYDPIGDFTQLALVGSGPLVLVVTPSFAGSAAEAIAKLRDAPADSITYASSGVGSIPHLAAELLRVRLSEQARFTHVPYRSGGQMVEAIAKGEGVFGVAVLASAVPLMRDGLVRGLALTGNARSPAFPELPTLAEGALPGFDISTWNVILGPRGMPPDTVATLNRAIVAALAEPTLRQRLLTAGVDAAAPATPEQVRAFMVAELAKFRAIVERTGVRLEA